MLHLFLSHTVLLLLLFFVDGHDSARAAAPTHKNVLKECQTTRLLSKRRGERRNSPEISNRDTQDLVAITGT